MNNNDDFIASLIARRDALNAIIAAQGKNTTLELISDYCDDEESIPSELRRNMEIFFNGAEPEITLAAEKIYMIGGIELGKAFCAKNELCAQHFCDPDNCIDDDHDN